LLGSWKSSVKLVGSSTAKRPATASEKDSGASSNVRFVPLTTRMSVADAFFTFWMK
jgi:hypothetical protein